MRAVPSRWTGRPVGGRDRQVKKKQGVQVDCCYCLTTQDAPEPPCLVDCKKCGRPFRVLLTSKHTPKMELSTEAQSYYSNKTA